MSFYRIYKVKVMVFFGISIFKKDDNVFYGLLCFGRARELYVCILKTLDE